MSAPPPSVSVAIVGGGITGLVAAYELQRRGRRDFVLLEADSRLGGKILTEHHDGFLLEAGPDSFVSFKPAALELCRELGLEERLQGTRGPVKSLVRREGRLHALPTGLTGLAPQRLRPLLTTRVISLRGKARAGLELFLPRRRDGRDESVAEFATRRFGREVYDWAIEPLLAGIHAADGEALSVNACYPTLVDMERTRGSILRQALGAMSAGRRGAPSPFMTLAGGTSELVEAIARTLPAGSVRTGVAVRSVNQGERYRITLHDGASFDADTVIVTTPAHTASRLLGSLDRELAQRLSAIPFASTATVSLGYRRTEIAHPLEGSGYVSPRAEGGAVVACTWTSSKFAGRSPEGHVLLRVFLGRAGIEEIVAAEDGRLIGTARDEVRQTMGVTATPRLVRVHRWPMGIPQYNVGHLERVAAIEAGVARHPGLIVTGASYRGAGLPDCIDVGRAAAHAAGS